MYDLITFMNLNCIRAMQLLCRVKSAGTPFFFFVYNRPCPNWLAEIHVLTHPCYNFKRNNLDFVCEGGHPSPG